MRYPPELLDEIRARLPVSQVVGAKVKLRKQGREFIGLSPFSAEKSPSFTVNDQKGFYHDFSSGNHGDIFRFVMATEGLSFPEAIEKLAGEAGVALPKRSAQSLEEDTKRKDLYHVLALAAAFFRQGLQTRGGAAARGYLEGRGLTPALCEMFQIGYAPAERFALRDHLAARNITTEAMIAVGLLIHGDDIAVPYDRFRNRIMFPICDRTGRVIAFGGRALDKDVAAKYLNSPETALFHKGAQLFNQHRARLAAHERGTVIVVEGYVDAIMVSHAGFPHVVAPLGTALTLDQCALLWRMAREPILCFDGDKAGRKAANRALDLVLPELAPERTLRFAFLPEGQDPDELIRAKGAEAFAACLAAAKPLVEVAFERACQETPLRTPEERAGLEKRLYAQAREIKDEALRRHYEQAFRVRLQQYFGTGSGASAGRGGFNPAGEGIFVRRGAGRFAARQRQGFGGAPAIPLGFADIPMHMSASLEATALMQPRALWPTREAFLLALVINHPALFLDHDEVFVALEFSGERSGALFEALLSLALEEFEGAPLLKDRLVAMGHGALLEELARLPGLVGLRKTFAPDVDYADVQKQFLQAVALHRRTTELSRALVSVRAAFAGDPTDQNFARLQDLLAHLNDAEALSMAEDGL